VNAAAFRVIELCSRLGVPVVRVQEGGLRAGERGVCGHVDVSEAFSQTDHWDPGPEFPWDYFMGLVSGEDDDVRDGDITAQLQVENNAFYNLEAGGGVQVVDRAGRAVDGVAFRDYTIVGTDGAVYSFGAAKNNGVFSYPGLPGEARQGDRKFFVIREG
jgi:hypothetical protein